MDSRDSYSSSLIAVTRDGGLKEDEDVALSAVSSSLAKEAAMLFQSRKYAECVDLLNQLSQKEQHDPKVLHNIALAEFFRDGCSDPRKFLEALVNVEKKYESLVCASSKVLDAALQPDECDASVAKLNKAIVLYHLHDYPTAKKVLEPLSQNIDSVDEGTSLYVCLLLLDLAVATQDALLFADVIGYMERAIGVGHKINHADNGGMGQQPSDIVAKSRSIPSNASTADDLCPDASSNSNASEHSLPRTLCDETIEYETLLSRLDISRPNSSRPSNFTTSSDLARRTPSDWTTSDDMKLKLPLYRVQLLFLTRSLKMAKRDLKLAMSIACGRDSFNALLLKSQLELARWNFVKAEKLLKASCKHVDVGSSIIYNNNVGCIFYQWGKHNTAGLLFNRALLSCSSLWKDKPMNLATISQDKSLLIMYNSGLQNMACGNPILAAQCFQKASLVFYNRPLLWLRLAECSLMALDKGLSKSFQRLLLGPEFKVSVLGRGKWRQLVVEDSLTQKGNKICNKGSDQASNLSISFARQCLRNAFHLVRHLEPKSRKSGLPMKTTTEECQSNEVALSKNSNQKNLVVDDTEESRNTIRSSQGNANGYMKEKKGGGAVSSFPLYEDAHRKEYLKIKQAILADLAFVELELGNPQEALSKAQSLMEIPQCSKMYGFLARVYAAEALCLLNKPTEAALILSVYISSGNNIDFPYNKDDIDQWQVNTPFDSEGSNCTFTAVKNPVSEEGLDFVFCKPEAAQGTLYVNLASMSAMQGDFEQAVHYTTQALSLIPRSRKANLMAVYLDLKLGRVQEALTRLRRCTCVSFLPCSSRSNKLS